MKNILLISGGLDSMILHNRYKDVLHKYVYIDYGHKFKEREIAVLKRNGIDYTTLKIKDLKKDKNGFFFGRNLRFMLALREQFINDDICVFFGNTANDAFTDNTKEFLLRLESVINSSYPHTFRIITPLENTTKQELIKEATFKHLDFYFCDKGASKPCGECHSCKAMIDAGYKIRKEQ